MIILHICLAGPFTDGFSYQENLLTKYHKKNDNSVFVITSKWVYSKDGNIELIDKNSYVNSDGVNIIRLDSTSRKFSSKFKRFKDLYINIKNVNPDIIFVHGCQFTDISTVTKYAKKNKTIIYVDNHADFSNSATNFLSFNILHKIIWRHYAKMIEPYVNKFYGVLPARVDFLKNVYKVDPSKIELLVMGADDDLIRRVESSKIQNSILNDLGFSSDDFIIITGGKIDKAKLQVFNLLEAVKIIDNPLLKVVIYGSIDESVKSRLLSYCNDNIKYVGWLSHEEIYKYISISSLAVYPGRHSVLWEETVGLKKPMIVKNWDGTHHIDIGGNVLFLYKDNVQEIENYLLKILNFKNGIYESMKKNAEKNESKEFLYSIISKKSIGDVCDD